MSGLIWSQTGQGGNEKGNTEQAQSQQGGITVVGNNDPKVSPYLKAWIMQDTTCVVGMIGEGTSREVMANWEQPFANDSIGSAMQKAGGKLEKVGKVMDSSAAEAAAQRAGRTLKGSTLATRQVWSGNGPHVFNLVMVFYALADAKLEVTDALSTLEQFMSPQLNYSTPGGRVPGMVMINIGRTSIVPDCIIKSISTPLDTEKTKDGHLARATVNLSIESIESLNRSDIPATYGG